MKSKLFDLMRISAEGIWVWRKLHLEDKDGGGKGHLVLMGSLVLNITER